LTVWLGGDRGSPVSARVGGRRCGLRALEDARQPASMAGGASRRSGVVPARRASHARRPGDRGNPPGRYYGRSARSFAGL